MRSHMETIWDEIKASIRLHQGIERQIEGFKEGDKVWLLLSNLRTTKPSKKLDNRKGGPFMIKKAISTHAYQLDIPKTMKVHNVFHINLLTPYIEDKDFERRQIKPPPIITEEGEEEYEVDHIMGWEWRKDKLYYQIQWKGYDPIEDTMERADKFANKNDLLSDLLQRLPKSPMPKDSNPQKRVNRPKRSKKPQNIQ